MGLAVAGQDLGRPPQRIAKRRVETDPEYLPPGPILVKQAPVGLPSPVLVAPYQAFRDGPAVFRHLFGRGASLSIPAVRIPSTSSLAPASAALSGKTISMPSEAASARKDSFMYRRSLRRRQTGSFPSGPA